MMTKRGLILILWGLCFAGALFGESGSGTITLIIEAAENNEGQLMAALFTSKDDYKKQNAFAGNFSRISPGETMILFEGIPFGTYGATCFHDANGNSKLDTNFIGIPKEGIGLSNNPAARFGPPKYEDAEFLHNSPNTIIRISLNYL